jgi:hypothetical protein
VGEGKTKRGRETFSTPGSEKMKLKKNTGFIH